MAGRIRKECQGNIQTRARIRANSPRRRRGRCHRTRQNGGHDRRRKRRAGNAQPDSDRTRRGLSCQPQRRGNIATNYPSVIDPALLDRMKRIIYVPPPKTREEVKRLLDSYLAKVEVDPAVSTYNGGLTEESFDEIWKVIRSRRQIYEASIPDRGIAVRDQYVITPRDMKNVIQEAASEASFAGEPFVSMERLLTLF